MSVLSDPVEEFWAEAGQDPLAALTEAERAEAERLIDEAEGGVSLAAIAVVLGGAFLLTRRVMARKLAEELPSAPTRAWLEAQTIRTWRVVVPVWFEVAGNALYYGAWLGWKDARMGRVPSDELERLATDYTRRLGVYLHASSREALLEGFQVYLNRHLPARRAAEKAIEAYGLSRIQMRALAASKVLDKPVETPVVRDIQAGTKNYILRSLARRAARMADHESFKVSQEGKQLAWIYAALNGELDPSATRRWVTKSDERVCKICGPLHNQTVGVTEPFLTREGVAWTTGVHPNCRCTMELEGSVIRKDLYGVDLAEFNEQHPRAHDGKFRTKTKPKQDFVDPRVSDMLAAVDQDLKVNQPLKVAKPLTTGGSLSVPRPLATSRPLATPSSSLQAKPQTLNFDTSLVLRTGLVTPDIEKHQLRVAQAAKLVVGDELNRPGKPKPKNGSFQNLERSFLYFDPTNEGRFEANVMEASTTAFAKDQPFWDGDTTMDQIRVETERVIDRKAKALIAQWPAHKPLIYDPEQGRTLNVNLNLVKSILRAEMYADDDLGAFREIAQTRFGVKRSDYLMTVFSVDRADMNEALIEPTDEHGTRAILPGSYYVDYTEAITTVGPPVRIVRLRPIED